MTTDDTVTLAYQIKEKIIKKLKKHKNYKLKMDQLTNDRLKTSRLHWGMTSDIDVGGSYIPASVTDFHSKPQQELRLVD